ACAASISAHAFELTGVSPKERACCACTLGVLTHLVHRYAQLGCVALVASIQVSAHPVAPSVGMVSSTDAPDAFSWMVWYGQAAPTCTSPFLNRLISSVARPQYFLIRGCCVLSSAT